MGRPRRDRGVEPVRPIRARGGVDPLHGRDWECLHANNEHPFSPTAPPPQAAPSPSVAVMNDSLPQSCCHVSVLLDVARCGFGQRPCSPHRNGQQRPKQHTDDPFGLADSAPSSLAHLPPVWQPELADSHSHAVTCEPCLQAAAAAIDVTGLPIVAWKDCFSHSSTASRLGHPFTTQPPPSARP